MTYLIIFRGDDTDFEGNQNIDITLSSEMDLSDKKAHFRFLDFTQDWDAIPEDKILHLKIPNAQTSKFPVGAMDAKLWLEDSQGRVRMVDNRIHIIVTDRVDEAYDSKDPQAITVVISGGAVSWDAITGKPDAFPTTWDNVSDKPETFPAKWEAIQDKPNSFPSTWDEVSEKPEKFDSSWDKISDKPVTFPAKWDEVSGKPSVYPTNWENVANKPDTFTPSSHTHTLSQVTDWAKPDWTESDSTKASYIQNKPKPVTENYIVGPYDLTKNEVDSILNGSDNYFCIVNPGYNMQTFSIDSTKVGRNVEFMWTGPTNEGWRWSNKVVITFPSSDDLFLIVKMSRIYDGLSRADNIMIEVLDPQTKIAKVS